MRRSALIILVGAGALVVLVVVAAAIAVATIDPRALMKPVLARAEQVTGRVVTVAGPIRFHVSLTPSIVLENVTVANAAWGRAKHMIEARKIEARFALLPLLRREFDVVEVDLSHPKVALETDAHGRGNWDFGPAAPAAPPGAAVAAGAATASGAAAVGIANIVVDDGELSFRDGATGKTTEIGIGHLAVHAPSADAPVAVDFRGKVGDLPVALAGDLGPVSAWLSQHAPYAVTLKGSVDGSPAHLRTKLLRSPPETTLDDLDLGWGQVAATGKVVVIDAGRGATRYQFDPIHTFGGTITGAFVATSVPGAPLEVTLDLSAQELDLAAIARASGASGDIRSGRLRVIANLASRGAGPEDWVKHLSGTLVAVAGPTTLAGSAGGADSALARIGGFLDPARRGSTTTELRCAVIRLPLADGVAKIDRSIGAETDALGILASGTIDFRNRTLDLALQPSAERGASAGLSGIAGLIRVRGPFTKPSVGLDTAAAARTLAGAGALAATGGALAVLGGALIAPGGSNDGAPCATALDTGARAPAKEAPQRGPEAKGGAIANDAARALRKLFGR